MSKTQYNTQDYTIQILPTTTVTINNSNTSFSNMRRILPKIHDITIDRCCPLFIHLLFYIIIVGFIYIQLGKFNNRQERLLNMINVKYNLTNLNDIENQLCNQKVNTNDCPCEKFSYPKRNRTTNCLELSVGLNETISNVFCPLSRDNNSWLVIQNRQTNSISFNRSWSEYRRGFGNFLNQTDIWIGNENLYWLTNQYQCRLKIELTDWYNETRSAIYELFRVSHQRDRFRLQIGEYTGNMEPSSKIDSFSQWHHNTVFSTYDHYFRENMNCSNLHGGIGWWFHAGAECAHVQLNGRIPTHSDGLVPFNTGILWTGWRTDRHYSYQFVRMSIQPKLKPNRSNHQSYIS